MKKFIAVMMVFTLAMGISSVSFAAKEKVTDQLSDTKLTFAYADAAGTRLLGFDHKHPKQYTQAFSAPGRSIKIQYVKHQKLSDESNGRNNMYNFDHDEGEIYKVRQGKVSEDESVVLATKDAFAGHTFLAYRALPMKSLDKKTIQAIEKAKNRKIRNQWKIGEVSSEVQVGVVEFERVKGKKPLASFVLVTKKGIVFDDYEGNEDENNYSTWRVDDGGTIDPELFRVIFVTRSQSGYAVGLEWIGFEGNTISVLQQDGKKFRNVASAYRYTAPL